MKQLDPKSVWLFFIGYIWGWFAFAIATTVVGLGILAEYRLNPNEYAYVPGLLIWLWVIIPVSLILLWVGAKLSYRFYHYELREDGFRKDYGVIWKRYVTIPYDRIQNVDINRGPIARILGLSGLVIQTAAGSAGLSGGQGQLPGLAPDVAEQLRDELIKRSRQSRTTNLGL